MPKDLSLTGKSALVTAGATGIGFACASRLLADGCSITIAARRAEVLEESAERLRKIAPAKAAVEWLVCDVTTEADVRTAVQAAVEAGGGLNFVVASAGIGSLGALHATSVEDWNEVMATNLTGTFLTLSRATRAICDSGGGAMVAVSSAASNQVHSMLGAYGASKAGIDMMVRHMADELGPYGVRVNAVRPGLVETEMTSIPMDVEPLVDDYLAQMPVRQVGKPEDVAESVRFLLGSESRWITGVCLDVDGGMHLRRAASYEPLAEVLFGRETLTDHLNPQT